MVKEITINKVVMKTHVNCQPFCHLSPFINIFLKLSPFMQDILTLTLINLWKDKTNI